MLPSTHRQRYEAFQQGLDTVQSLVGQDNRALKPAIAQLQQQFQQDVLSLDAEELPEPVRAQVQSYQVEMNKQIRLLGTDASLLQAARQPATIAQRQQHIHDRLATLTRYCNTLLE